MRILDKYLIKYFLAPLFYCLAAFIFLFIVIDLFGRLDEVLKQGISFFILQEYYLSLIPFIVMQTAPVASLIATIYVIGTMNKYGELTAMASAGINRFRVLLPFIYAGIILSILLFALSEKVLPESMKKAESLKENYMEKFEMKKNRSKKIIYNIALYGRNNNLIFIDTFDTHEKIGRGITILHEDKKGAVFSKTSAQEARWEDGRWLFSNILIYKLDNKGDAASMPNFFEKKVIDMEKPKELVAKGTNYEFMSFKDLADYIKNFSSSSPKIIRKLKVDLYQKLSFPFISLVVILIGAGFAIHIKQRTRSAALMGVGISIVIGFIYYAVMATCIALGKSGFLEPFLSAHLANILFGAIGIALIFRS